MNTKSECYKEIELLLRSICHDPKCKTITICPNKCKCRKQRKFKLNTETAMCWLISKLLADEFYRDKLTDYLYVLCILSQYHMTDGWFMFFDCIFYLIDILQDHNVKDYNKIKFTKLCRLKKMIPRLKREKINS